MLGGGDGLAVREILKHPTVTEVVLVDLDPEMTRLAGENPLMRELNQGALSDPRVQIVNADAFVWLADAPPSLFDAAFVDFPDPHNFSLGKLYTRHFYARLRQRLDPEGVVAVQSTSPLMARQSYWCINRTLESAGFQVRPYHALVPSFGEWGFVLGALRPFAPPTTVLAGLRYLDAPTLSAMFVLRARTWRRWRPRSTASTTRCSCATTRRSGGAGTSGHGTLTFCVSALSHMR